MYEMIIIITIHYNLRSFNNYSTFDKSVIYLRTDFSNILKIQRQWQNKKKIWKLNIVMQNIWEKVKALFQACMGRFLNN